MNDGIEAAIFAVIQHASELPVPERVEFINSVREALHNVSPFKEEPGLMYQTHQAVYEDGI